MLGLSCLASKLLDSLEIDAFMGTMVDALMGTMANCRT